jgi:hypothetical protein
VDPWHSDQIADSQIAHLLAHFDDPARDLMPEYQRLLGNRYDLRPISIRYMQI